LEKVNHDAVETLSNNLKVSLKQKKTSTRRRSRVPCVVVEKIMTFPCEGIGVVVDKKLSKSTNFQRKFV